MLALRYGFAVFLTSHGRLNFDLVLFSQEVALMVVLSLEGASHFKFTPVVAHVGTPCELVCQSCVDHVFLDSIYNIYNIINVFFEVFTLLEAIHGYQIGLLISNSIQVPFHRALGF